jgi:dTDP-4-dehydrorhamnose 3,5-epimerase
MGNQVMEFTETEIDGLTLIKPLVFKDDRGVLIKDFHEDVLERHGVSFTIKEQYSQVSQSGVLRGLHFQRIKPQAKLVRVLYGTVFDVALDLRRESATFGQWKGFLLSADNNLQLLIPAGFAHGYLSLTESIVLNRSDQLYDSESDTGILYNDASIGICWPMDEIDELVVSSKDKALPSFETFLEQWGGLDV